MTNPRRRHPLGLTLIEVMTVLVILTIISAIVLPQFGKHDDLKVTSASRELVADLLYAQSQAIATGKIVFVQFDPAAGKYQVLESIDPPQLMPHPASHLPFEIQLGTGELNGVTIATAGLGQKNTLAFDATGGPFLYDGTRTLLPLDAGAIVLCSGEVRQTVSIQPVTGEIKVH